MNGCLKGFLRLGFVVALLMGVGAAWWFREPLVRTAARWFGPRPTALPPVADTAVGAPTPSALASGQAKLRALGSAGGPDSVVLTANEMAALVGSGIDWSVRKAFDSLRVELLDDEFAVHARLDTRDIPRDALGPFAGVVEPREPFRLAGPVRIERPGEARWTIEELSLRGVEIPAPLVTRLAQRLAGADGGGAVAVQVDRAVADLAVHPTGVVLYRRKRA